MIFYQLVKSIYETYSHRLLTEEFEKEAIKLVAEQNINIAQAGRQLDIAPKSIHTRVAQTERNELKATLCSAKLTADQQRISELERKLTIAKMERNILKMRLQVQLVNTIPSDLIWILEEGFLIFFDIKLLKVN